MANPDTLIVDGHPYSWQRLCELRRQQLEAWRLSQPEQPALFALKADCRPQPAWRSRLARAKDHPNRRASTHRLFDKSESVAMSNLVRLSAKIQQNPLPKGPSKPSKGTFEPFEGDHGSRVSGIERPPQPDAVEIEERKAMPMGGVPEPYLDAWARLQCQKPVRVSGND